MNTTDRAVGWIIIDDAAGDEGEGVVNSYVLTQVMTLSLQTASQVGLPWFLKHQVEPGPLKGLS